MNKKINCNKQVERETSRLLNIDPNIVADVISFHSKYTKEIIESNSFDGVRYLYLGKIVAKIKKLQMRNEYKRSKSTNNT